MNSKDTDELCQKCHQRPAQSDYPLCLKCEEDDYEWKQEKASWKERTDDDAFDHFDEQDDEEV